MQKAKKGFLRVGAMLALSTLVASCAIDPSSPTLSGQNFAPEMTGAFNVVEMSDSRAGFSRLTTSFSTDGTTGSLVYDYSNGKRMDVELTGCASYTRHILPGVMHDNATVEQDIHEVRCRSTGSIWRVAMFRKGAPGKGITASLKAATGYEFSFDVPFKSTVAVEPARSGSQ
ncbi:hypothetical protein BCY88_15210 [Paraburkholderia fungorum]|uniref:Lipoprotein n=2 Tax=Paraburkholderia fungorum TaxID=134537 RepID=A0A420GY85_9BURK|nr:hypothetical protein BCY88_15210 [Paraburkholderia fungorum]